MGTFGFRSGFSCDDVLSILMQTISVARQWGLPLIIAVLDIKAAFDNIQHHHLASILRSRGVHPTLVQAILREISFMRCSISLPGTPQSDRFPLQAGGKQGGIETPDCFNTMVEYVLEPVLSQWRLKKIGFHFGGDEGGYNLSHLIWADNFIILPKTPEEFLEMVRDMTEAISSLQLSWKPSSLECMLCGSLVDAGIDTTPFQLHTPQCRHPLPFAVADRLVILGACLSAQAETEVSVEYRLAKRRPLSGRTSACSEDRAVSLASCGLGRQGRLLVQ